MCGIIGVASIEAVRNQTWLTAGRDAMRHRGPDGAGEHWSEDGRVGFGHRRLAIIDLSPGGHQPMQSADAAHCITFNGEIYNFRSLRRDLEALGHVFHSHSDTEVVLAAYRQWGEACLERLHGMFAFALHDRQRNAVFLARDRAGEKPLFYHHANGTLRFASELKGLLADPAMPRRVDREALDCYLTFAYVPGERCMLQGYHKLPAAHAMTFDCATGALEVRRYWSLPDLAPAERQPSGDELVRTLEDLLEGAVRRQLVADVPVGLLLSGGVDSSLITALAARSGQRLKTFTVGFKDAPEFDETAHADLIARHFGTDHTVLDADAVAVDLMPRLARQFDEPMVDSSMIPTFLVTQQIGRQCKVALGGDGGDELFGGYYSASRMAQLQHRLNIAPLALRRVVSRLSAAVLPPGLRGRPLLIQIGVDPDTDVPPFMPQFEQRQRRRLMTSHADWPVVGEAIRAGRVPKTTDAVQRVTRFDFMNYMPEDILVKVDRASMLNSLEVRSPFLDVAVIEFAYGQVPTHLKASPQDRKIILKKLAEKILPRTFDRKRKQGFGIPIGHWLRAGPWRSMFEQVLYDSRATFSRIEVERLFRSLESGRAVKEHLFALGLFELWRREYGAYL
jgi:asparagine synthase (glutamine-hydrolysing)